MLPRNLRRELEGSDGQITVRFSVLSVYSIVKALARYARLVVQRARLRLREAAEERER